MSDYAEKRAARIERLRARADKLRVTAEATNARASTMAEGIPLGQPILQGHHSERRDRNYRARINSLWARAAATYDKAAETERRASAAERNTAISADNPEAASLLGEKILGLEAERETIKAANQAARRCKLPATDDPTFGDRLKAAIAAGTITEAQALHIAKAIRHDWRKEFSIPAYVLSSLGANIRRLQERQKVETQRAEVREALAGETPTTEVGAVRVVEDHDANRVRIVFPGKPAQALREKLKSYGYRWAPSEGAWQRQLNPHAVEVAKMLAKEWGGA